MLPRGSRSNIGSSDKPDAFKNPVMQAKDQIRRARSLGQLGFQTQM